MESFITETLDLVLKNTKSFENVIFILPSQRAGVFVKQELKNKISTGFLPRIINIGDFIEEVSGIEKLDSLQLLFHFYGVYKKVVKHPDRFDTFSSWAITVLQDFNEIDQHLIPAKEIFTYLRDINRLQKWSDTEIVSETTLMKSHYAFMEQLYELYEHFYSFLVKSKQGYQGVLYRESTQKLEEYLVKNSTKKFFFIGFNALNTAEEALFQKMLAAGNTEVFWDIDKFFYESKHQAGSFIRKYKANWNYYQNNPIQTIANNFQQPKNIQIIGAAKNITQIKYAGEILSKFPSHHKTALVLGDESLLPITLNSLPKHVEAVNITMGYPLKDVPLTALITALFKLHLNQKKLQQKEAHLFYHKDVITLLKQAPIYQLLYQDEANIADAIAMDVAKNNVTFLGLDYVKNYFDPIPISMQAPILSCFEPFQTISDFLVRVLELLLLLKETANEMEKEYLFRFYTVFMQLQNLHATYGYIEDVKTLYQFFKQLMQSESISFQGEPLQGLQLMGVLETRVLDFDTIIITSVNEGVLPGNHQQNSFVPLDVKIEFGLPTYREKDALFSYHFFRLLQRASTIFILYNTEHDSYGGGEKSRFLTQLEMLRNDIKKQIIIPNISTTKTIPKEILKNENILIRLKELAAKGISPSALTNYLYNPMAFYKQKVLKIKEFEDVEETIAVNTMGTVVHDTLEYLYKPCLGQYVTAVVIAEMEKKVEEVVVHFFKKHFKNGDISFGKNRLIFEVAKRFVANFLRQEKQLVQDPKNQLKIIATEQTLSTEVHIEGFDFPIKIHGQVDRIDQCNGVIRIIDYKTGRVNDSNLKISDFGKIEEPKYHKAIQVMLYAFLYTKYTNFSFNQPLEAGIYSFKNLGKGFLKMNFSSGRQAPDTLITPERLDAFMDAIKEILKEIYDPNVSFTEPLDLKY